MDDKLGIISPPKNNKLPLGPKLTVSCGNIKDGSKQEKMGLP